MVKTVFNRIENSGENMEYSLKVSCCEIYNEHVRDLILTKKNNLQIHLAEKGSGFYVKDLSEHYCISEKEVF